MQAKGLAMRIRGLAIVAGFACALSALCAVGSTPTHAQAVRDGQRASIAQPVEATAQSRRRRAPTQLRVIRQRAYLPPTAVRACDAWYEQEFRPSGTVIVPRMRCRWVAG
jgi:hypothetical protein